MDDAELKKALDEAKCEGEPYVLVDVRSIVGNCVQFWRKDLQGYTCDLDAAHVFTEPEAFEQHQSRPEIDQPVPLRIARSFAVTHVRREPLNRWLAANPDDGRIDTREVLSTRRQDALKKAGKANAEADLARRLRGI